MKRIQSIDVLRGYDMLWITGGASGVIALAKELPSPVTDFLAVQVTHAEWGGFHHHDLIFPLFLFLPAPRGRSRSRAEGRADCRRGASLWTS